jgi:hypothetical protein
VTLHEGNLYSFVDPERSRLKTIIDIGGLDQFNTQERAFAEKENECCGCTVRAARQSI